MDVLGVSAGQRGRCPPVEASVEREDREVGGARRLVDHAGLYLLGAEVSSSAYFVHILKFRQSWRIEY